MPRKPSVRYFPSRGAFYCQLDGKQHKLAEGPDDRMHGPTYTAALRKYKELLAIRNAPRAGDTNTLRVIAEAYLQSLVDGSYAVRTYAIRQEYLTAICNGGLGEIRMADLHPDQWRSFLATRRGADHLPSEKRKGTWTGGGLRIAHQSIQAALNWGVRARMIPSNPLAGVPCARARSRGRECVLSPGQEGAILASAGRALRDVALVLANCGARPMEIAGATAADWDGALGAFVYHKEESRGADEGTHKSRMRGKDRFIFLTGDALELVEKRVAERPTGPLFRTRGGYPWTAQRLAHAFTHLAKRLKIASLSAYSFRHTFATRWLLAGEPVDMLAELLGNSPATIRKHYSHLMADPCAIRSRLERFKAEGGEQTRP